MQACCAVQSRPAQTLSLYSRQSEYPSLVKDESEWRAAEIAAAPPSYGPGRVIASRWRSASQQAQEFIAGASDHHHVVAIALRGIDMRLTVGRRPVHDGVATSGAFHLTAAGDPVRCLFRGPYDVLHLYLPTSLVKAQTEEAPGAAVASLSSGDALCRDAIVESLGRSLVQAEAAADELGSLFVDSVGAALAARLLALSRAAAAAQRRTTSGLVRWRLKRAIDYIESRLEEPTRLADVASATGLTRMHFAAQFRAATGLRPHEYMLRRRIDRAKEMLAETGMSVLEVALSVGFQSPSHFTTVFKRFTGEAPFAWRQSQSARQATV
jgi:AraC family transcriptional regulator